MDELEGGRCECWIENFCKIEHYAETMLDFSKNIGYNILKELENGLYKVAER